MDIAKLLDSIKLSPKHLFAVLVAGLVVLLAGDAPLKGLGLTEFRSKFLPYIGVTTLLAASLLLAHGVASGVDWLRKRRTDRIQLKHLIETLHDLTPEEKNALKPYIEENANTSLFEVNSGIAGGLEAKKIIYRSSSAGYWTSFPYNLQPWARNHLRKHPELLD